MAACDSKEFSLDELFTIDRPSFDLDTEKYGDFINRDASSPGYLIRKRALEVYELDYNIAKEHKAIAQSDSGAWGWSKDWATPNSALDRALELCEKTNHQPHRPCKIVNVDGYWAADFFREKKL
jgi:hypothetical protein